MSINVKVNNLTSKQLSELSAKRKGDNALVRTKIDIVAELVANAHKKECKQ